MDPVHDAARANEVEALRALLDADPSLIEAEGRGQFHRQRPLHFACMNGCVEAVELLLDRGADCSAVDRRGDTPFMMACAWGHAAVVTLLLARGVDPTERDERQMTCMMRAAYQFGSTESGRVAVLGLLIKDGRVDVDARDSEGNTALWWACNQGRPERARALLMEGGADHTITGRYGMTPMAAAKHYDHLGARSCMRVLEVGETTCSWDRCALNVPLSS